jgi:hypothetical protein
MYLEWWRFFFLLNLDLNSKLKSELELVGIGFEFNKCKCGVVVSLESIHKKEHGLTLRQAPILWAHVRAQDSFTLAHQTCKLEGHFIHKVEGP